MTETKTPRLPVCHKLVQIPKIAEYACCACSVGAQCLRDTVIHPTLVQNTQATPTSKPVHLFQLLEHKRLICRMVWRHLPAKIQSQQNINSSVDAAAMLITPQELGHRTS